MNHNLSSKGRLGRRALRRFLYAQMALRDGLMIALGKQGPLVRFTVEDDPPSVYFAWRLTADAVEALPRDAGLPAGTKLAPLGLLDGDEPEHIIVLNVYRVSGITNGLRAEWSVFIEDDEGIPRYLVVDARADNTSMDPVEVITKKSKVEHARNGNVITMTIGEPAEAFTATITTDPDAPRAKGHPDFMTANDTIYWGNGVYDRAFYDTGMANPDQISVAPEHVEIVDKTRWAKYVDLSPVRTIVFRNAIELVVSPWANVEDLD